MDHCSYNDCLFVAARIYYYWVFQFIRIIRKLLKDIAQKQHRQIKAPMAETYKNMNDHLQLI
jgi:hypothetical protein